MINKLREINKNLLLNAKTNHETQKQKVIMNILEDSNCFAKISMEDAYSILKDLKIKDENIEEIYVTLVSTTLKKVLEK